VRTPRDSDRLEPEGRKTVRKEASFGQEWGKVDKTVRKEASFGQEWGQGVQSCQKAPEILTG
jgi:hypothetical protein